MLVQWLWKHIAVHENREIGVGAVWRRFDLILLWNNRLRCHLVDLCLSLDDEAFWAFASIGLMYTALELDISTLCT
jgi:hypothetical protein